VVSRNRLIAAVLSFPCQPVAVRLHPVIEDAATVVSAVRQPLSLHSELDVDVDVYRLHCTGDGPDGTDLVARVFGPGVERATVEPPLMFCRDWQARGSRPNAARGPIRCLRSEAAGTCSSPST
jgi:hypothetical protein